MQYTAKYQSPVGEILLTADEIGLTGYAGGVDKKERLLILEGVVRKKPFVSTKGTVL